MVSTQDPFNYLSCGITRMGFNPQKCHTSLNHSILGLCFLFSRLLKSPMANEAVNVIAIRRTAEKQSHCLYDEIATSSAGRQTPRNDGRGDVFEPLPLGPLSRHGEWDGGEVETQVSPKSIPPARNHPAQRGAKWLRTWKCGPIIILVTGDVSQEKIGAKRFAIRRPAGSLQTGDMRCEAQDYRSNGQLATQAMAGITRLNLSANFLSAVTNGHRSRTLNAR